MLKLFAYLGIRLFLACSFTVMQLRSSGVAAILFPELLLRPGFSFVTMLLLSLTTTGCKRGYCQASLLQVLIVPAGPAVSVAVRSTEQHHK
jgi:hypothetical protein